MSKDVVLIPCWRRPEFLYVCLEQISKARGADKLHYFFSVDHGYDPEVLNVINMFDFSKEVYIRPHSPYKLGKQSFNLLKGYEYAAEKTKEFVFMIEEDVFIADDFFEWHYAVQGDMNVFCSIATKNNNFHIDPVEGSEEYYTHDSYQSLGVCFHKSTISDYIVPHIVDEYFTDPMKYVSDKFPNASIGNIWAEQDGLIRRIQEEVSNHVSFPIYPKAFHAGFYGYNRPQKVKMPTTLAGKVDAVRQIAFDPEMMKKAVMHPEFFNDSVPVPLQNKILDKVVFTKHYS